MTFETIMVAVNQGFAVHLKSSATNGYLWQVHTVAAGVQFLGSSYEGSTYRISHSKKVIQIFRFRAPIAGAFTITFILKGQTEAEAIQIHTVTLIVS